MESHRNSLTSLQAVFLVTGLLFLVTQRADAGDAKPAAVVSDAVVAGDSDAFMEVRHIVLKGTNHQIGFALAQLAKERFGLKPATESDPLRTRVQRKYFERNYPVMFERMQGVAEAFGVRVDDDRFNVSHLGTTRIKAGCSVMYLPSSIIADGQAIFSRNYDFSLGTLYGTPVPKGELSPSARPCIIEMHPDKGYASIAVYCYDMLCGVLDGINSEGLCVALLADDQLMRSGVMEPTGDISVGLGVQQTLRFLLDTCATVEEAKEALLFSKLYYEAIPCHFIVADRHGKSFVFEYSQAHNKEHIIESPGKPLITTNFSLHRHARQGQPPNAEQARTVCPRYCLLAGRLEKQGGQISAEELKQLHHQVDGLNPPKVGSLRPPLRTLWHALYFPELRKMQVSFYLGEDSANGTGNGKGKKAAVIRSKYLEFELSKPRITARR